MPKKCRQTNKVNAKGRNKHDTHQYLQLPYNLIKSPQFRSLNGNDIRILLEICSRHNGFNNGRIAVGLQDLTDTLMMSKSTADRGVRRLQKAKFLIKRKQGKFLGRLASEWEITFLPREGCKATNEWGQTKAIEQKRKVKPKTWVEECFEDILKMKQEEI